MPAKQFLWMAGIAVLVAVGYDQFKARKNNG